VDVNKNVFRNLLDIKADASEVLFVNSNGSVGYALYNGAGARQDEVPPNIAHDRTVPAPYTQRLQCGVSCFVCHAEGKSDGWRAMPNQVLLARPDPLTGRVKGPDLITDQKALRGRSQAEVIELLASKYAGNADDTLAGLRRSTIANVLRATGPWEGSKDQTDAYSRAAAAVDRSRRAYWYTPVGAATVLQEIMVEPTDPKADPVKVLRSLLPPDPLSKNDYLGAVLEDPMVGQLLNGNTINRNDWELLKAFVATRAYQTITRGAK
jgi:hypothetical protein